MANYNVATASSPLLISSSGQNNSSESVEKIDDNHFIGFTIDGTNTDATARTFAMNTSTYVITTVSTDFVFDTTASIAGFRTVPIDANHFLVCWSANSTAFATVIEVNTSTYAVSTSTTNTTIRVPTQDSANTLGVLKFDTNHFVLSVIDGGKSSTGYLDVIEVNTSTWAITTKSANAMSDYNNTHSVVLDATHFICLEEYEGSYALVAQVYAVNTSTWAITTAASSLLLTSYVSGEGMSQIDTTHFVAGYGDWTSSNYTLKADVLSVNTSTWAITTAVSSFEIDATAGQNSVSSMLQVDTTHFVISARYNATESKHNVIEVNTSTYAVSKSSSGLWVDDQYELDQNKIILLDNIHYVGVYHDQPTTSTYAQAFEVQSVSEYYFDSSDSGPTDANAVWTNDTNIDDGVTTTYANANTAPSSYPTINDNYLETAGTNAPASGGTISRVSVRSFGYGTQDLGSSKYGVQILTSSNEDLGTFVDENVSGTGAYTDWTVLSTPTGGWSWTTIQALKARVYLDTTSGTGGYTSKIEIEVVYETSTATTVDKTVTAKARILSSGITKTVTAKSRIKTLATTKTVQAKANINGLRVGGTTLVSPAHIGSGTSPVVFVWEIATNSLNEPVHSQIQIDDTSDAFGSLEIDQKSWEDNTGMEYWNGSSWVEYPLTGVTSAYFGNQARLTVALTDTQKWWRVRGASG